MSTDDHILRANTSWLPETDPEFLATVQRAKSITDVLEAAGEGTPPTTSKLSVGSTTSSDTDSEFSDNSVTGYEDLSEVMDLDYQTFLRWAALRNTAYRRACINYAIAAESTRDGDRKHPTTISECEWYAEKVTSGLTKSYPFEAPLIQTVLFMKRVEGIKRA